MKPITLTQEAKDNALELFKKLLNEADCNADLKINITTETLLQSQGIAKPIVYISTIAYVKMQTLINKSDKELAWYGITSRVNNNYFIEDILVYPQTVTSTTVDADEAKCAKWFMELSDEVINHLKFQGHSHVNMAATPSGRDTANWLKFANLLKDDDYYILCIGNKNNVFYWNIYDKALNVFFENKDITMVVVDDKGQSITSWAEDSIKKYVEVEQPKVYSQTGFLGTPSNQHHTTVQTKLMNGQSYTMLPTKSDFPISKGVKEMLSYVPAKYRDEVNYDVEVDIYYTDSRDIPDFYYSSLYECYISQGERYRALHSKVKSTNKKDKKETSKKGVKS